MRVDLVLKNLCLVKSRSSAKHLCGDGAILVNGQPVKPSTTVRTGDKITIRFPSRTVVIEILDIPRKQLSKSASQAYYGTISEVDTRDVDATTE